MLQKSLYWVSLCLLLQSTSLVLWERIFEMDNTFLKQIVNCITLLKYRALDHFPQTLFQTFQRTRFRLATHNLATRQESIG